MFSTDQNIEYIGDFVEEAKTWLSLKSQYTKYSVIEKVVRICTALVLVVVIALLLMLMLIYLSFAAAYALETLTDSLSLGFLIVSAVYLLLLIIVVRNRHAWIERPMVKFLVGVLTEPTHNS